MPSRSERQRNFIFAKRGEYKTKSDTPEDWKWVWNDEWEKIEERFPIKRYKPLFESNKIIYFIRATDKQEVQSKHYGDYWRFFKSLKDLSNLIKSNQLYVAQKDKNDQYMIIGQGNIDELELNYSELNDDFDSKEMHFKFKDLFDKNYTPSSKVLYAGKIDYDLKLK
jgi:hypothetical protein